MKIHHKTCISHLILPKIYWINPYQNRSLQFDYGKIAGGITEISRAVQRTHRSNVPRSPLQAVDNKLHILCTNKELYIIICYLPSQRKAVSLERYTFTMLLQFYSFRFCSSVTIYPSDSISSLCNISYDTQRFTCCQSSKELSNLIYSLFAEH